MPYPIDLSPIKQKMMKQMQLMKEATMKLKKRIDFINYEQLETVGEKPLLDFH